MNARRRISVADTAGFAPPLRLDVVVAVPTAVARAIGLPDAVSHAN
jgi:hypothetical protein